MIPLDFISGIPEVHVSMIPSGAPYMRALGMHSL
jgi:hypothetical protein